MTSVCSFDGPSYPIRQLPNCVHAVSLAGSIPAAAPVGSATGLTLLLVGICTYATARLTHYSTPDGWPIYVTVQASDRGACVAGRSILIKTY